MANSFTVVLDAVDLASVEKRGGFDSKATKGTLPEVDGVLLSYEVLPLARNTSDTCIRFTVEKKPFYVPMDAIENHVKALIGG